VLVFDRGEEMVIYAMPARKQYWDMLPWSHSRSCRETDGHVTADIGDVTLEISDSGALVAQVGHHLAPVLRVAGGVIAGAGNRRLTIPVCGFQEGGPHTGVPLVRIPHGQDHLGIGVGIHELRWCGGVASLGQWITDPSARRCSDGHARQTMYIV